jgi:hypothetical protein
MNRKENSNKVNMILSKLSFWFFISLLIFSFETRAQINILRYNDNFSKLKNDTAKVGLDQLKMIKAGVGNYASFGGELREQFQYFDNSNFGDTPPNFKNASFGQLWHRIMLHSNLELGSKFRAFVQLNSTFRFYNDNPLTPEIDQNELSLHQAFLDYQFNKNSLIRVGRQEVGYGNNRVLTFREGPNTRLTTDALTFKYKKGNKSLDLFVLTPVIAKSGVFDDVSFKDLIAGIHGTTPIKGNSLLMDYYSIQFESKQRRYNFVSGNESRQSIGLRIFSKNPKLNYEVESTYQLGKFNDLSINAFGISTDLNYKIADKHSVIVGLGTNYFTGDKDRADNQLNTYNLILSKPSYGLAAPIGSSNIQNLNPYVRFSPINKLSAYLGVYFLNRQSTQDGTYSPGMAQVRPTPNALFATDKKGIGNQYAFETWYQLNAHFSFAIDGAFFTAGSYVAESGKGKDILYLSAKAAFKF